MLRNRKGIFGILEGAIGPVVAGFYVYAVGLVIAAVALTPSHVERRASGQCLAEGGTVQACADKVGAMSLKERKAYIRDTQDHPVYWVNDRLGG